MEKVKSPMQELLDLVNNRNANSARTSFNKTEMDFWLNKEALWVDSNKSEWSDHYSGRVGQSSNQSGENANYSAKVCVNHEWITSELTTTFDNQVLLATSCRFCGISKPTTTSQPTLPEHKGAPCPTYSANLDFTKDQTEAIISGMSEIGRMVASENKGEISGKLTAKVLIRRTGAIYDHKKKAYIIQEEDLFAWFENGDHLRKYSEYDTL